MSFRQTVPSETILMYHDSAPFADMSFWGDHTACDLQGGRQLATAIHVAVSAAYPADTAAAVAAAAGAKDWVFDSARGGRRRRKRGRLLRGPLHQLPGQLPGGCELPTRDDPQPGRE